MQPAKQNVHNNDLSGIETAVQGNTQFALDLYQKLRTTKGNLFFSPYSISTALAMTFAGARGDTQAQMAQALHFPLDQEQLHPAFAQLGEKLAEVGKKGHSQLSIANSLWPRTGYKLLKEFLTLAKKSYGVRITPVDYSDEETARQTINTWVEDRTTGKIKDMIPAGVLGSLTRLVLVNAIYFKGEWASQFKPHNTNEAPFFVAPDSQVQVPMMMQKHEFNYREDEGLQILELPYTGNDLSMILLLPGEPDGLANLEEKLAAKNLNLWIENLEKTEVQVFLPRFAPTFPFRLDDTLKSMGMVDAFSDQADFSGMDGARTLFIGAILHKAFVDVNEQGTEAAAATAVMMQTKALFFPAAIFRADHPFVFVIRENRTGSILFLGRVTNPV
jgi:serpin B